MNLSLVGKHALVCGSTQGIGRAAAFELANLGANVTLMARNSEKLESVKSMLDVSKGQVHDYIVADFSNLESIESALKSYLSENTFFHIVVNNTGGPAAGLVHSAKAEEFVQTFSQHLLASHLIMQAVLPGMKQAGYGRFINIISTSVKQPLPNLGVSNTIRAAMANWAKTLANEVTQFGITVNNVLPGATETERLGAIIENRSLKTGKPKSEIAEEMQQEIPARRFGKAEEVGAAIAFLASPAAAYISGINLPVDGGRTASL